MNLHILNNQQTTGLALADQDDAILLIEDGVYLDSERPSYVLKADLEARGLAARANQTVIDYDGFVDLCTQYSKVITW